MCIRDSYLSDVDFEEISLTGKSLDLDPNILETSANSFSMFNSYKLIILESLKDKNISELENVINSAPDQTMLIVKADISKKHPNSENYLKAIHNVMHWRATKMMLNQ